MREYELPGGLEGLFRPSTADRIIGSKEESRATKTFFHTSREALLISLLLGHARMVVKAIIKMHHSEFGEKLTFDQAVAKYDACKNWLDLHQQIVEHYASNQGFAVEATVRVAQKQLMQDKEKAESSVQKGEGPHG